MWNLYSLMLHSLLDWSVPRKGTIKECKFHLCSRSSSSSTSYSTLSSTSSSTLSLLWKPSDSPLSLLHPIKAIHCWVGLEYVESISIIFLEKNHVKIICHYLCWVSQPRIELWNNPLSLLTCKWKLRSLDFLGSVNISLALHSWGNLPAKEQLARRRQNNSVQIKSQTFCPTGSPPSLAA